ncbi:hypothetical protein Nwat_1055 [Nitrosococcus watsonii C-113]|uniref:Uncharacterized protein n=1 Tax=Nitrosococcus watsoni (strain C-113) TaxID=105559 RepID=D8K517_NITWC|nr:hypothetical protein Nwat_1055 [Nitrosococcus watsonii C-113]
MQLGFFNLLYRDLFYAYAYYTWGNYGGAHMRLKYINQQIFTSKRAGDICFLLTWRLGSISYALVVLPYFR